MCIAVVSVAVFGSTGTKLLRASVLVVDVALPQEFDTVLAATGRNADVKGLGLENLGVALSKDGKVIYRTSGMALFTQISTFVAKISSLILGECFRLLQQVFSIATFASTKDILPRLDFTKSDGDNDDTNWTGVDREV